jgi:hypothetical protein
LYLAGKTKRSKASKQGDMQEEEEEEDAFSTLRTLLHEAAKEGRLDECRRLVEEEGMDVNDENEVNIYILINHKLKQSNISIKALAHITPYYKAELQHSKTFNPILVFLLSH